MTSLTETDTMVLQRSPLFRDLPPEGLREVAALCRRRLADKGQTIIAQGEPGESMLIILFGEVEYRKNGKPVGKDGSGSFFGELSLLGGAPEGRAVSVVASEDCVLLELYRPEFEQVILLHPKVALVAMQAMAKRLKGANPQGLFKSKSGLALTGVAVALLAKLLSRYVPKEMASEASTALVGLATEYAAPSFAVLAMVLKHVEVKNLRKRLFG